MKYPVFKRIFFSKFNLSLGVFVFLLFSMVTLICTSFVLMKIPSFNQMPQNVVEVLDVGEDISSFITVVRPELIEKRNLGKQFDGLDTKELIDLSGKSFVESIYVIDEKYMDSLKGEDPVNDIVAIPDEISSSPNFARTYPGFIGFKITGRLPENDKREAVISYQRLQKEFGFEGKFEEAIGQKISLNGVEHTVVGLTNLPQMFISFSASGGESFGVFKVSKDSTTKLNEINEYKLNIRYPENRIFPQNVFIIQKNGREKEVTDYLVDNSPSYQFSSNYIN